MRDCARAIDFLKTAFGAEELLRTPTSDGKIGHAEVKIGDSIVMMGDEAPENGVTSPQTLGGCSGGLLLYVNDVDSAFERAIKAGAVVIMPVTDMYWGDRYGKVCDPFGHIWALATHMVDPTPEQMADGQRKFMQQSQQGQK
jgi:PhnB protein